MGCAHSKDHPKNADLIKLKKKYDTEPIKQAKLLNIWVIGGNKQKSLELASLVSQKLSYLLVTEDSLLQTEMGADSERGRIIKDIIEDKGTICPGIVLDLAVEHVLEKLDGLEGLVFHGIPRDRDQAWHLQKLIGPASLVIYCELKGESLRAALAQADEDPAVIKTRVDHFQKSVLQLSKHKTTMTVDGDAEISNLVDECVQKISSFSE